MFRVSPQEFERLKNNARMRGYPTAAAFIRSSVLDRDLWLEKKISEILDILKEKKN